MKKTAYLLVLSSSLLLFFSSCRKEADYMPYPGEPSKRAYNTYAESLNTSGRS